MPRTKQGAPPTYRKHRPSGQAVVTLSGRDFYLGPHGSGGCQIYNIHIHMVSTKRRQTSDTGGCPSLFGMCAARPSSSIFQCHKQGLRTGAISSTPTTALARYCGVAACRSGHRCWCSPPTQPSPSSVARCVAAVAANAACASNAATTYAVRRAACARSVGRRS